MRTSGSTAFAAIASSSRLPRASSSSCSVSPATPARLCEAAQYTSAGDRPSSSHRCISTQGSADRHRPSLSTSRSRPTSHDPPQQRRNYQDYIRTISPTGGSGRIPLKPGKQGVYGLATSRGTRAYQEDTTAASCVTLPTSVLKSSYLASSSAPLRQAASEWSPGPGAEEAVAGQIAWFGCFDGHGGQPVSQFLRDKLHAIFEDVEEDMVTDTVQYTRSLGGYFRRFNGGLLERWVRKEELTPVRAGAGQRGRGAAVASRASEESRASTARSEAQQRQSEEEQNKPKTFADLVNSAKQSGTSPTGSGSGTVSAIQASQSKASEETPAAQDIGERSDATQQPALIHSADSCGETPLAGPVEEAQSNEAPTATSQPKAPSATPPSDALGDKGACDHTRIARRIEPPSSVSSSTMTLSERLTLAWLHTDRLIQTDRDLDVGGSTASVVLLHSLDTPTQPFYSSSRLFLTTAHIGDTRMLLASVATGQAIPLTNYHHPDDRSESERLRKMGAGMITDSFGEARWMGALANTRSFGDSRFKKVGVTVEPEVISQLIKGEDYAFVVAFSDGIGGVMSDQEVVDLCRDKAHPDLAARAVLRFAEELGAQDNGTVLVVPLKGWGKMGGEDGTRQRREFRRSKVDLYRDSRT